MARELALRLDPSRFRCTLCVTRLSPGKPSRRGARPHAGSRGARGSRCLGEARQATPRGLAPGWSLICSARTSRCCMATCSVPTSGLPSSGRLAGVPVIVAHEHGWSYEGQPVRRFLDRVLVARSSDAIIASSEAARTRMVEVERINPERTRLVYIRNGIAQPVPSGRPIRAELGIPDDAPLVLAVARLDPYKSLHVLASAAQQLAREFPDLRVLIAGEGPERPRLERLIAKLRLTDVALLERARMSRPDRRLRCGHALLVLGNHSPGDHGVHGAGKGGGGDSGRRDSRFDRGPRARAPRRARRPNGAGPGDRVASQRSGACQGHGSPRQGAAAAGVLDRCGGPRGRGPLRGAPARTPGPETPIAATPTLAASKPSIYDAPRMATGNVASTFVF